ncbi:MAG TPA: acyl carrier protein [Actinocrinis sp.]|jgi:acyl carrier protein|uniref:acyl carrier protein n=1 Tax=Actinocrinis sp. TaxID=1920516 RepID=UPI002DDDADA7|nr:acyl carrier protein [Actinocrinis sp.]HEV3171607.1 acyl carrier protein [Actinocrinis sp.]
MTDEIRAFIIHSLSEMNYDVTHIDQDTVLGPAGADLESLALAELSVRIEDRFGVRFEDEEAEKLVAMTVAEFAQAVAERLESAPAAGR